MIIIWESLIKSYILSFIILIFFIKSTSSISFNISFNLFSNKLNSSIVLKGNFLIFSFESKISDKSLYIILFFKEIIVSVIEWVILFRLFLILLYNFKTRLLLAFSGFDNFVKVLLKFENCFLFTNSFILSLINK